MTLSPLLDRTHMNAANDENIRSLEQGHSTYLPPTSLLDEKRFLTSPGGDDKKSDKMNKLQHILFTLLLFALLSVGIAAALTNSKPHCPPPSLSQAQLRFKELLNTVEPSALHEVLHEQMKDKYKHGVFQEDRTAVEAIHEQNAEAAESLIELAKRQATGSGNGTVVTTTAAVTTEVTSTAVISTSPSSSPSISSESESSTSAPTSEPSSTPPSTSASSSTVTSIETSTSATTTSIAVSSSQSAPSSSLTPKASTSQSQSDAGTATTPSSSRTTVFTTTMANGALVTVTSITVIPAGQADQTAGGSNPTTTRSQPSGSLQTGASMKVEIGLSAIFGALGMAVMSAL